MIVALVPEVDAGLLTGKGKVNKPHSPIIHDSHYVPRATLRRWSIDGTHLFAYRILVSNSNVPEWKRRAIRGIAYHRDLYTTFAGDKELDDFERWLNVEFEQPGLKAIDKLLGGSRLTVADWQSMILFVAAQDVRTPLSFIEWMGWCEQEIPAIIDRSLRKAKSLIEGVEWADPVLEQEPERSELANVIRVAYKPKGDSGSDQATIGAEVTAGRRLWIAIMRRLLSGVANTLCHQRWSVAEPADGAEWSLTDHPVLRLNYYKPGHYDFKGGWGSPGTEIMMPVSPKHLLYVKVGKKASNRFTFSPNQTQVLQRFLVERAHRWVFATQPAEWVAKVKPRTVNPEIFAEEKRAWEDFHRDQSKSEASSRRSEDPEED